MTRTRRIAALVIGIAAATSSHASAAPQTSRPQIGSAVPWTLTGRVVDLRDVPVPRARVQVLAWPEPSAATPEPRILRMTTQTDGVFSFTLTPPTKAQWLVVKVDSDTHRTEAWRQCVFPREWGPVHVVMRVAPRLGGLGAPTPVGTYPEAPPEPYVPPPDFTVSGIVRDDDGAPLPDAHVTLVGGWQEAFTDDDGAYLLEGLVAKNVGAPVEVRASGFLRAVGSPSWVRSPGGRGTSNEPREFSRSCSAS